MQKKLLDGDNMTADGLIKHLAAADYNYLCVKDQSVEHDFLIPVIWKGG